MTLPPPPRPHMVEAIAPYHVVPQFMGPGPAQALREDIDQHFDNPHLAGPQHQVWNYWHVPDAYTYLRTSPEKIIARERVDQFFNKLRWFSMTFLGMDTVSWPNLSLYVEGCGQALHNDSRSGTFGYVYSLTHWDGRCFKGGETLIFREQDYWAGDRFREAGSATSLYETIPTCFDQLLLCDDRLIHGVPEVRGTNDPRQGRIVLHGHIQVNGVCIEGPLLPVLQSEGLGLLGEIIEGAQALAAREPGRYHGFATCAMEVAADGRVSAIKPLLQRVLGQGGPQPEVQLLAQLRNRLLGLRFEAQAAPSRITVPMFFE